MQNFYKISCKISWKIPAKFLENFWKNSWKIFWKILQTEKIPAKFFGKFLRKNFWKNLQAKKFLEKILGKFHGLRNSWKILPIENSYKFLLTQSIPQFLQNYSNKLYVLCARAIKLPINYVFLEKFTAPAPNTYNSYIILPIKKSLATLNNQGRLQLQASTPSLHKRIVNSDQWFQMRLAICP